MARPLRILGAAYGRFVAVLCPAGLPYGYRITVGLTIVISEGCPELCNILDRSRPRRNHENSEPGLRIEKRQWRGEKRANP